MLSHKNPPEDFILYINSRLPHLTGHESPSPSHLEVQMAEPSTASRTDEMYRGINNKTLFCLGVALLEIAHWKPLTSLWHDYDADEIQTARRLAGRTTSLGKFYQEIIQKCLRCDFGFGTDLSRTELQSAVYSDVVCPLEELIEKLSGLGIYDG
jgi:hypothetical protein